MPVSIQLNDDLASHLKTWASSRRVSLDEFAQDLLGNALKQLAASERWQVENQRRIELIRKSRTVTLTADEQSELDRLQDMVDQHLEPLDEQFLQGLNRFEEQAARSEFSRG